MGAKSAEAPYHDETRQACRNAGRTAERHEARVRYVGLLVLVGPQITKHPGIYLPLGEKALGGFRSCNFALFKNAYSRSVAQKRGFSTPPNRRITREERIYGTKHALEARRFSSFGLAVVSRSPNTRHSAKSGQKGPHDVWIFSSHRYRPKFAMVAMNSQ